MDSVKGSVSLAYFSVFYCEVSSPQAHLPQKIH